MVKVDRKGKGKGIVIYLLVKGRLVPNCIFFLGEQGRFFFFLNVNFLSAHFCNIVNSRDGTDPIQYQY